MSAANSYPEMSTPQRHWRAATATAATLLALLVTLSGAVQAQTDDLRLPVSLDADSTAYDGKSSMVMFKGLRLTQGRLGIAADEGYASKMDFEDSTWHFQGNVVIDVDNGRIESDSADMVFSGYRLKTATIIGTPAIFDMQRPGSEERTHAEAGKLVYNFDEGIVEFSDQATITEGGNLISSNYLVYNIREQRINASSGGEGDPKVRITYTPAPISEPGEPGPPDDSVPDDDSDAEQAQEPPEEGEAGR